MHILVSNLHKTTSTFSEEFTGDKQAVPQVGKVRMNPELPSIAKRLYLLRLADKILKFVVFDIPLARARLPVGAKFYSIRRVYVNGLHPPAHTFLLQKRVHHDERVAEYHSVLPIILVFVKLNRFCRLRLC